MTQITLRTGWYMALSGLLIGVLCASYISCRLVAARYLPGNNFPVKSYPVAMPNAEAAPIGATPKTVYVKGRTIYRDTGRVDTIPACPVSEFRVDTLMLPYPTGVEHDTTFLARKFDVLAAFQPRGHFIELVAGAEHDLVAGGYGGQFRLQLNLDKAHIANLTPFVEAGYLHGLHGTVGVEGVVWGVF